MEQYRQYDIIYTNTYVTHLSHVHIKTCIVYKFVDIGKCEKKRSGKIVTKLKTMVNAEPGTTIGRLKVKVDVFTSWGWIKFLQQEYIQVVLPIFF